MEYKPPPATQQMDRSQAQEQPEVKQQLSLEARVATARESAGRVLRAQIIAEEARLSQAKDQDDFQRCVELQQSVQQLKQRLEQVGKEAEEKVRWEEAAQIRKAAERKKQEEAARKTREEQERRGAEERARKEAGARAKQAAERKAREEAEEQWERFRSTIQTQKLQTEAKQKDAVATEKFEEAIQLKAQRDHLATLLAKGEMLKDQAGPAENDQQKLKQQLEALSLSIANGPQRSRLRGTEMEEFHSAPFDTQVSGSRVAVG
jgi:colicin import membrane protein